MSKLASVSTLALSCALLIGAPANAANREEQRLEEPKPSDAILGEWWTEGKEGRIRFVRAVDGTYSGILVGPDAGTKDVNNKDAALRSRPLVGVTLMWHLRPDNGEYVDGWVYNPRNGETYRMKAKMKGKSALEIRGYLGISLLGQSQTWTRAS